ncbi:MAG: hypothetical protein QGG40_02300 [Myxococcota bacterium]|nr:hypothetical protein [Myxococcota bacterium]
MREALRFFVYLVAATVVTWPLATDPTAWVVGAPRSDTWNSLWGLWFVEAHGPMPTWTSLLDHPRGGRIAVADPLNGLLAIPLVRAWGPVAAYAMLVLGHLGLAGWAADLLGRACGGRGWVAGFGYQLAPIALAHLNNGASEAVATGWLPLSCWATLQVLHRGGSGRALAAGALLFVCALGSWYAGIVAWVFAGAAVTLGTHPRPTVRWSRAAPAAILALGLTLPVASSVRAVAQSDEGLVAIKADEDLHRIRRTLGSADPRSFFMPGEFRSPNFPELEGNPSDYLHTTYPGWFLFGLALWCSRRRTSEASGLAPPDRVWWTTAGACAVLSLGPVLVWDGVPVDFLGRALPLPYLALEALPGFSALSLLYRLAIGTTLALCIVADRAAPGLAAVVALEALLLSPALGGPAVTRIPDLGGLTGLEEGAVLNLPITASRTYLFEQTVHGQPLVGSLNTGTNLAGLKVASMARKVRSDEASMNELKELAREQKIRWIVVHRNQLMSDREVAVLGALRRDGELASEDAHVRVYRLY